MLPTTTAHITLIIRAECPSCGETVDVTTHIDQEDIPHLVQPRPELNQTITCEHCEIPFTVTKLHW